MQHFTVEVERDEPETAWDSLGRQKLVGRLDDQVVFELYEPDVVSAPEDATFDRDLSSLPGLFQKVYTLGLMDGRKEAVDAGRGPFD